MGLSMIYRALICIQVFLLFHSSLAQNSPQDFLDPHNAARGEVGVGPLEWDDTLANYASNYANQHSGDCVLQHSGGPYGENLYGGPGAKDAVSAWVEEKQYYDHNSNTCAPGETCGHYTQVVWRKSVRLGCASIQCANDRGFFTTCNYDPPGNYVGYTKIMWDMPSFMARQHILRPTKNMYTTYQFTRISSVSFKLYDTNLSYSAPGYKYMQISMMLTRPASSSFCIT
ncbi:pathogenesis-related protein 1-like [Heracleum sosnowskyi]|uniref:Pathogenesis-related protein 1-like n=1 Tax=Heracleum sosnowskyi TaxID=360622 RepID=A0AAD8JG91_9APIA|nr:pathogenesis-related protein 1-like [Heracleum sosnowskyi]